MVQAWHRRLQVAHSTAEKTPDRMAMTFHPWAVAARCAPGADPMVPHKRQRDLPPNVLIRSGRTPKNTRLKLRSGDRASATTSASFPGRRSSVPLVRCAKRVTFGPLGAAYNQPPKVCRHSLSSTASVWSKVVNRCRPMNAPRLPLRFGANLPLSQVIAVCMS